jgi:hypothetical protein
VSAFHATQPLTADMKLVIREMDPRDILGRFTPVKEMWAVKPEHGGPQDERFVFIDRHGITCSRCPGHDCGCIGAVLTERDRRQSNTLMQQLEDSVSLTRHRSP